MKKGPLPLIVLCLALQVPLASSGTGLLPRAAGGRARAQAMPLYRPGEVIVGFSPATSQSLTDRAIRSVGGVRARRSAFGERYVITLADGLSVPEAVARFRAMPEVEYAEPNGMVRAAFTPNDEFFSFQWNMQLINAPRTWDIQEGRSDVIVAVVDTGIAFEDFGPYRKAPDWGSVEFVQGFDFVNGDDHPNDDDSHGTHISSTIAEAANNGIGVAGLAFNCALMPVKVLDNQGFGSFFDVAEGIDYATNFNDNGRRVKVINLSLGGPSRSETAAQAITRALAAGIVVVAAAGNEGLGSIDFPAAEPNVIAVGAVDARRQRAYYSNYGPELDVMAPGGDLGRDDNNDGDPDGILQQTFDPAAARNEGRYDQFFLFYFDGTSSATAHVSAMAALLVSQGITDPAAVKASIESTAMDLGTAGRDDTTGHGLMQPAEALKGLGLGQ